MKRRAIIKEYRRPATSPRTSRRRTMPRYQTEGDYLSYDTLVGILYERDREPGVWCWRMPPSSWMEVMNILDPNGRPIFMPFAPGPANEPKAWLMGFPVRIEIAAKEITMEPNL